MDQPKKSAQRIKRRRVIKISTVSYGFMAIVGFELCWWYHKNAKSLFSITSLDAIEKTHFQGFWIVGASIAFLVLCQIALGEFFPSYRRFKASLAQMFEGLSWWTSVWLALTSAFGEEILFRGALQPFLGPWITTVVFGALHLDPEAGVSVWTLWSMLAGLILSWVVIVTGSLWPAIAIHFGVNLIGLIGLSRAKVAKTTTGNQTGSL